ncbi:MAG: efflux RND transporter periplasmic adaptor subunit [Pseudomonadota bacterium]
MRPELIHLHHNDPVLNRRDDANMTAESRNHPINLTRRGPTLALIFAASSLVIAGCAEKSPEHQEGTANQGVEITGEWVEVETTQAEIHAWFPGSVIASQQAPVASRLSGYVRELAVDEGDTVREGDLLLVIDPANLESQIQQAEANLSKARSAFNNARSEYERFKSLFEKDAIPKRQFEQVRLGLEAATGDLAAAEAAVAQARSETDYSRIEAPYDGVVTERHVEPGQLANPGQPLLMLQGSQAREIRVEVDDSAFAALPTGTSTQVNYRDAEAVDRDFTAEVITAISAADPVSRTHTVKLAVPESVEINPGQFVSVRVTLDTRGSIVVPNDAIHQRAGIEGVFVLDDQNRARFRVVRFGRESDGESPVLSGIVVGDRVITNTDGRLANGVTVRGGQGS